MTRPPVPATSPALVLLDQLDKLRAKATPGPWTEKGYGEFVAPDTCGLPGCTMPLGYVDSDRDLADAALIVAAVNAAPKLTAALRAVLTLADEWESTLPVPADDIRSAITSVLEAL